MPAKPLLTLILSLMAAPALAEDFTCTNRPAEISCREGRCDVNTDGFTPMSLAREGSRLTICAYSGCWDGPILVRRTRADTDLLFAAVANHQSAAPEPEKSSLAVIYDRSSRSAQMQWGGFSNVMECAEQQ